MGKSKSIFKLSKVDKYIIKNLYFLGYSKDDIYNTLKRNDINIPRSVIRQYLSGKLKNKRGIYKNHNNFNERLIDLYDRALHRKQKEKEGKKGLTWEEYREQKKGLQDNFLKSVIISGLNKGVIHAGNKQKFQEKYKKLVKWNNFTKSWVSP